MTKNLLYIEMYTEVHAITLYIKINSNSTITYKIHDLLNSWYFLATNLYEEIFNNRLFHCLSYIPLTLYYLITNRQRQESGNLFVGKVLKMKI
jgi:hypothetical protein